MFIWRLDNMCGLQLDMDKVRQLIDEGYISVKQHPEYPLFIYNYTPQCQFDWHWTPETITCRGLILDEHDNVVARPFPKFFTPEQYKTLRNHVHHLYGLRYKELYRGGFTTTEKVDGSMGTLYLWDGKVHVASRGSFMSPQAVHATELIQQFKDHDFRPDTTYIFEIVYPENRIVVDYGDLDQLFLLTCLDNDTGEDVQEEPLPPQLRPLQTGCCEIAIYHCEFRGDHRPVITPFSCFVMT